MLKQSHKKHTQAQALKMMVKSMHKHNLNEINMTNVSFTQPVRALAGSPCFDFSFELREFSLVFKWLRY